MVNGGDDHQLGDFIRGRFLFIEKYCKDRNLDPEATIARVKEEMLRLTEDPKRKEFLENRVLGGAILASSVLPDWLDAVFLRAMTHVLQGGDANLFTRSSKVSCIPFEAGRFNAHRQADSVFRILFSNKKPEDWLRSTFGILYTKCYGDKAARYLKVEEAGPKHYRITMNNRNLEKAGPMDCSTVIGYLYGSLEKLGARNTVVTHDVCGVRPGFPGGPCIFEATWE